MARAIAALAFCVLPSIVRAATPPDTLDLLLTPIAAAGRPVEIDVTETLGIAQPATLTFRMADRLAVFSGIADRISGVTVTDVAGALPIAVNDDAASGERTWRTTRPVRGRVVLRYRVAPSRALATAPVIELRADGSAISGYGETFLLTPDGAGSYATTLRWNLSALGSRAQAVSSLYAAELRAGIPPARLRSAVYIAGTVRTRHYAGTAPGSRLDIATDLSRTSYSVDAMLNWANLVYTQMPAYLSVGTKPMTIILRQDPHGRTSALASDNGLLFNMPATADPADLEALTAHEISHFFFIGPDAPARWFAEGFADFLARDMPFRSGLRDARWFVDRLNANARSYFGNPKNRLPISEIDRAYWTDPDVTMLPYERGAFYFEQTDAKIRAASGGRRSLADIVSALSRTGGRRPSMDDYLTLLRREIGDAAQRDYDAMLRGDLIVPDAGVFGPCVRREAAMLASFDMGFDTSTWSSPRPVVRNLDPASAAARAGLREGDVIVPNSYSISLIRTDPTRVLDLPIERNGRPLAIRFAPAGKALPGFRWQASCGSAGKL